MDLVGRSQKGEVEGTRVGWDQMKWVVESGGGRAYIGQGQAGWGLRIQPGRLGQEPLSHGGHPTNSRVLG